MSTAECIADALFSEFSLTEFRVAAFTFVVVLAIIVIIYLRTAINDIQLYASPAPSNTSLWYLRHRMIDNYQHIKDI